MSENTNSLRVLVFGTLSDGMKDVVRATNDIGDGIMVDHVLPDDKGVARLATATGEYSIVFVEDEFATPHNLRLIRSIIGERLLAVIASPWKVGETDLKVYVQREHAQAFLVFETAREFRNAIIDILAELLNMHVQRRDGALDLNAFWEREPAGSGASN